MTRAFVHNYVFGPRATTNKPNNKGEQVKPDKLTPRNARRLAKKKANLKE